MTKDIALKLAIEALEESKVHLGSTKHLNDLIQACKEALEPTVAELNDEYLRDTYVEGLSQPAQTPVAWMHRHAGEITEFNDFQSCQYCEPLYTHPASSWQGLSDDEIDEIDQGEQQWWVDAIYPMFENKLVENYELIENYELLFARAIERALKVKNT